MPKKSAVQLGREIDAAIASEDWTISNGQAGHASSTSSASSGDTPPTTPPGASFPPRRVEILRSNDGYFKPGQYGYAIGSSTHGGMHTMDKGDSAPGELVYLVSKSKGVGGGALWFSADALRFTQKAGVGKVAASPSAPSSPWQGTDYNERSYNNAYGGIVGIDLDGVEGVSPVRRGLAGGQISTGQADANLAGARDVLRRLEAQRAPRQVKTWHAAQVKKLRDLIEKAQAVRDGAPQKMTEADYAARRASLGAR